LDDAAEMYKTFEVKNDDCIKVVLKPDFSGNGKMASDHVH
jgi:hypothetical protein